MPTKTPIINAAATEQDSSVSAYNGTRNGLPTGSVSAVSTTLFELRTRRDRMTIRRHLRLAVLVLAMVAATFPARAQTFSVLYNFGSKTEDPVEPAQSVVAQGRDGNLYSATGRGGIYNDGAVFKITPSGTPTLLYSFNLANSGPYGPFGGLTLGTDGNFYGTTVGGGASAAGTVFKITPSGTVTILHVFTVSDGNEPYAPPIQGTDGNLYGTAVAGGTAGAGTIYKITPSGTFTLLHSFDNAHGSYPDAPLVQGTDGNFYGTAAFGGAPSSYGVVYKITAAGQFTVLYNFDQTNGEEPIGPLIQASDGNFYGTTFTGGPGGDLGAGVIFKITAAGTFTVLRYLDLNTDGGQPSAGLVQATDGKLYGTAMQGGTTGQGTIFSISPQSPYAYTVLYSFNDGGFYPEVTLLQHTNGILYGDTYAGGNVQGCDCGVFYSLNIAARPFVSLVSTSGKVGKTIEILGQGFTGTTSVSFNGTAATFHVSSDTYLTATVPNGAKTGYVNVVTPGGTLKSNKTFRVTPQITSFNPPSGPVGTPVIITGVSLTQGTKVVFGRVKATTFTVNSDTEITATVPTGAVTGKIAITTAGGNATSAATFTVTP
jgi:uncharacterized repeat protein (TIGR03803 family)